MPSRRLHLLGVRKRNEVDVHSFAFPRSETRVCLKPFAMIVLLFIWDSKVSLSEICFRRIQNSC